MGKMYTLTTSTGLTLTSTDQYRITEWAEKLLRLAGELGVGVSISVADPSGKVILTMSREAAFFERGGSVAPC